MPRCVLFVAPRPPHPVAGGQDLRLLQHLSAFGTAGWDVHLFSLDPTALIDGTGNDALATCHVASDPSAVVVQGMGDPNRLEWIGTGAHPFAAAATATARAQLAEVIRAVRPIVVVVTGHGASATVDTVRASGVPLVVDFHDVLMTLIAGVGSLHDDHRAMALLYRRAADAARAVDAELLATADQSWACSDHDGQQLARLHPGAPLVTVPNAVDIDRYLPPEPSSEPRLVFAAGFGFAPNLQAGLELIELLDHLPGVALDLVGTGGPEAMGDRGRRHGVTVTGWVPDVRPFLQRAWVAVMPIRAGSGTRLKVAEAAAARLPIVATAKAVEGTSLQPDVHYLRADDQAELVASIRRLLDDPALRHHLAEAAHALARRELSWEVAGRAAIDAVDHLLAAGALPR